MQSAAGLVVVLGTGGTIAGTAADPASHVSYKAGQLGVDELIAAVPSLHGQALEAETVARMDSSDMDHATWALLAAAAARHLARPEVAGVVVTHGTDTLEETAYFLHRVMAPAKPLVLTAAMRPATALSADGPQNLCDAVTVARMPGARGVLAVLGGQVMAGHELRKVHGYRQEAFSAGDAGPLGMLENNRLRSFRPWPQTQAHAASKNLPEPAHWPLVELVTSHAGATGSILDALVSTGVRGIVVAGTGNGSVHAELMAAAHRAQAAGVVVRRSSRCLLGGVVEADDPAPGVLTTSGPLTPYQARIELMLDLMAGHPRPTV
jgi:L-asparaginase